MIVIINGEEKEMNESLNLEEIIKLFSNHNQTIIVELNGKIIKKEKRKDYKVNSGDRLELIQLVGGG